MTTTPDGPTAERFPPMAELNVDRLVAIVSNDTQTFDHAGRYPVPDALALLRTVALVALEQSAAGEDTSLEQRTAVRYLDGIVDIEFARRRRSMGLETEADLDRLRALAAGGEDAVGAAHNAIAALEDPEPEATTRDGLAGDHLERKELDAETLAAAEASRDEGGKITLPPPSDPDAHADAVAKLLAAEQAATSGSPVLDQPDLEARLQAAKDRAELADERPAEDRRRDLFVANGVHAARSSVGNAVGAVSSIPVEVLDALVSHTEDAMARLKARVAAEPHVRVALENARLELDSIRAVRRLRKELAESQDKAERRAQITAGVTS